MIPGDVRFRLTATLPVHDPPAVWKSWRNNGGNPGVEVQMLPLFSTGRVWRFDTNNLPQLEPIPYVPDEDGAVSVGG